MKCTIVLSSVVVLCLAMVQGAQADDLNPPYWRGMESTTSQIWEFNYDPGPSPNVSSHYYAPDGPATNGQAPLAGTHAVVFPGSSWMATDTTHNSGRVGIWSLSGSIDVIVDNHEPPNEFKWVWVQISWAPDQVGYTSAPTFTNLTPAADPNWPVELISEIDLGFGWTSSTYQWRIYPNPTQESFRIGYNNSAAWS